MRAELQIARDLSRAFDAWDRFDHAAAAAQLELYRPRLGGAAAPWFNALKPLTAGADQPRRTPARLWDLWLNAERRAAQCRYDDAVARGYRLLEWTAQWLLATKGIDTADLREDQIPSGLPIHAGADGRRQAGLRNAWELAAHHLSGEVQRFVQAERDHLLDHLRKRNHSILAHGDLPIARADWEAFAAWIESALIPLLRDRAAGVGLKTLAPQLPRRPLWS
ncbi:MAG: TIGR02710 family CRISPR-associated CARF protein [Chromatiaceae bacterium]|nr:TIGR02710 family CRISPR-associated CARF protein [Chromatiaceae bacterium]